MNPVRNNLADFIQSSEAIALHTTECKPEKQLPMLQKIIDIAESHSPLNEKGLLDCYHAFASKDLNNSINAADIDMSKLNAYLVDLERSFPKDPRYNTVVFIEYLANQLIKFSNEKIFPQYNGRIGRIITAYLLARAGYPIFNFNTKTNCPFSMTEALQSANSMCWYLAELVKSCVSDEQGNILTLQKHYHSSSEYVSSDKRKPSNLTVHWHELNAAIKGWKQAV